MKYKTGQIFFWYSTSNLFGKAIDYFNQKEYGQSDTTHCGIVANVSDKVIIYEASSKGFKSSEYAISWLDEQVKKGIVHIGEVKQKMNDVEENCKKYQGIKYGWLDILGIAFFYLTGYKLSLTGKNSIICSEAVSRVVYDSTKSVDFQKEYNINYDLITPQQIFMSKQGKIL
jgi:hypothetical protein